MEEIDVFYQTDSINFNYEEVGYVTAYANIGVPDSLIIKRLQYNSYLLCGNGIIQVTNAKTIKDGVMQNEYSGISVIIEKDSIYNSNYPFEANYSFYEFATSDYTSEITENTPFGNFMIGVGAVATVVIILFFSGDEDEEVEEGI